MAQEVTKAICLVKDETVKPEPMEYPRLLPTLQTYLGMVLDDGQSKSRGMNAKHQAKDTSQLQHRALLLLRICSAFDKTENFTKNKKLIKNFEACCITITKEELLDYVRSGKRVDIEQAVAMVIAFLLSDKLISGEDLRKEFEPVVYELVNDASTIDMFKRTCMWREAKDFEITDDPREAGRLRKKQKILQLLQEDQDLSWNDFTKLAMSLRRRRPKLGNTQHLTIPEDLLPGHITETKKWTVDNSYRCHQDSVAMPEDARIIPKRRFRPIWRLLRQLDKPLDAASRYAYDVEAFIKRSGGLSRERMAALEVSDDLAAIAYSFIAAQRRRQPTVVSNLSWSRFLIKGEGALLLQNRPDVLTSFENILVEQATDLRALTAVACPPGVRDHFSQRQDIERRARAICEMMERYVRDFGGGKMSNLVFSADSRGGSGRGPVDFYNALCDELRDCRQRARAAGFDLDISPVHKFLAKDIMHWNNAWEDDAFAGGKVPGWLEYLARVRADEINLDN